MDGHCRLPGKALDQRAHVGGGTAHVHNDAICNAGKPGRAPHAVGGSGGDGQHRKAGGKFRVHQGTVVLAHKQGRVDAQLLQGLRDAQDGALGHVTQAGVEGGGIFPLQQTHPPVFVGEADAQFRGFLADKGGRLAFVGGVNGRENPANRHGPHALPAHVLHCVPEAAPVQGRNFAAVELVAAGHHVGEAADGFPQLGRPVHQGRQQLGGRQAQPEDGGGGQFAPFQQGVGEVGRPDHHRVYSAGGGLLVQQFRQRPDNSGGYVGGGWHLGGAGQ